MYLVPSTYTATTSRRWEMAITSASVCLETRSAVRCLVPVSCERIVGSGISCTFAIVILVALALRMMAPSIFATWYRNAGVKSMSSLIPPEFRKLRSSGSPITIRPPVWACRMLSMPSRKAVPGAIISSAFINPGSALTSESNSSPDRSATTLQFTPFSVSLAAPGAP